MVSSGTHLTAWQPRFLLRCTLVEHNLIRIRSTPGAFPLRGASPPYAFPKTCSAQGSKHWREKRREYARFSARCVTSTQREILSAQVFIAENLETDGRGGGFPSGVVCSRFWWSTSRLLWNLMNFHQGLGTFSFFSRSTSRLPPLVMIYIPPLSNIVRPTTLPQREALNTLT